MSRDKGDAFNNLKLDAAFFQRVLQKEASGLEGAGADYDIYLMEKSVMPVLLQGLDALSRHVDKLGAGGGLSGGGKAPFNPLTWLAQYLLRNHPEKVKDHRAPIYQKLGEWANIERGRRALLRRKPEMEEEWAAMGHPSIQELPEFIARLDQKWNLDGAFVQKLPSDFRQVIKTPPSEEYLIFMDFWDWFEPFVAKSDLLRSSVFDAALRKREETERLAKKAQEELARHEQAMQEVIELRRTLEDQFASVSADLYTNDIVTQILNKSFSIQGVQEQEGGPPLTGVHIELLVAMLGLWGFAADPAPGSVWNGVALAAWTQWLETYGPEGAAPKVDSNNLRKLMDRDAFQAYLIKTYPAPEFDAGTQAQGTVEVQTIIEGDDIDFVVEAIDEETGEKRQLVLPEAQVEEVRRRLTEAGGEPVLARVDLVSQRVTVVIPVDA